MALGEVFILRVAEIRSAELTAEAFGRLGFLRMTWFFRYPMKTLVIGCGYLGERVAKRWLAAGHEVAVVTRSRDRAERFQKQGFVPIVADVTQPGTRIQFFEIDTVLYSV